MNPFRRAPRRFGASLPGKGQVATLTQITVGASAAQLLAFNGGRRVALIGALAANTGKVYLGKDNTVTASGATGGTELSAGASLTDTEGDGAWWAIGSAAGQVVSVMEIV